MDIAAKEIFPIFYGTPQKGNMIKPVPKEAPCSLYELVLSKVPKSTMAAYELRRVRRQCLISGFLFIVEIGARRWHVR